MRAVGKYDGLTFQILVLDFFSNRSPQGHQDCSVYKCFGFIEILSMESI